MKCEVRGCDNQICKNGIVFRYDGVTVCERCFDELTAVDENKVKTRC